mmetsp:Transcript_66861/g.172142  ORF Transcript_66861/g.172142 Transcript_66861/m.172142 type:complete len:405 (+) Transcript_66861:135-1349(+)
MLACLDALQHPTAHLPVVVPERLLARRRPRGRHALLQQHSELAHPGVDRGEADLCSLLCFGPAIQGRPNDVLHLRARCSHEAIRPAEGLQRRLRRVGHVLAGALRRDPLNLAPQLPQQLVHGADLRLLLLAQGLEALGALREHLESPLASVGLAAQRLALRALLRARRRARHALHQGLLLQLLGLALEVLAPVHSLRLLRVLLDRRTDALPENLELPEGELRACQLEQCRASQAVRVLLQHKARSSRSCLADLVVLGGLLAVKLHERGCAVVVLVEGALRREELGLGAGRQLCVAVLRLPCRVRRRGLHQVHDATRLIMEAVDLLPPLALKQRLPARLVSAWTRGLKRRTHVRGRLLGGCNGRGGRLVLAQAVSRWRRGQVIKVVFEVLWIILEVVLEVRDVLR